MAISLKTFNGHDINDGINYQANGLDFLTRPGATLVFSNQANGDPVYAGVFTGAARNIPLEVQVLDYANRETLIEQIKNWLERGTSGLLVATLDDGQDYQIYATVQSFIPDAKYVNYFTVVLQAGSSTWSRVTPETDTWNAGMSALTKVITVGGSCETKLGIRLMAPGAGGSGYLYQYLYKLVNFPGIDYGARPWCITIDTAILVTAGKLLASCYDLRVVVNAVEVKRWIADPNTNHTKVWFTPMLGAGLQLILAVAVPATGVVGELAFKNTSDNLKALKALPASGILAHGTEWIQYNGKDPKTMKLGVVMMGTLGTTRQVHAIGSTFSSVSNVIYILAGNAAAADPAATDATYDYDKPVFDLSASDNTTWVYTARTLFYDADHPTRPGSWIPSIKDNGSGEIVSHLYNFSQDAASGTPAMGAVMECWQKSVTWQKDSAKIDWQLYCPGGFATAAATGSKYRSTVRWPGLAALQKSDNADHWASLWAESTPVNPTTWTAFTHTSIAISPALKWLQFSLAGDLAALANAAAYFEVLTATVTFSSGNLPDAALESEQTNYHLAVRITNHENLDAIELNLPMLPDLMLVLDGEMFDATFDGVNVHGAMKLNDDSRDVWIRLLPGSNMLEIAPLTVGEDIMDLAIELIWYPRKP
jgi:hypothetical protein